MMEPTTGGYMSGYLNHTTFISDVQILFRNKCFTVIDTNRQKNG